MEILQTFEQDQLDQQTHDWNQIVGISSQIETLMNQQQWHQVLFLVEERSDLLNNFFAQPICQPLCNVIPVSAAEIEEQHQRLKRLVNQGIEHNEALHQELSDVRNNIASDIQTH